MSKLTWDNTGERFYETGVDHCVLYLPTALGVYDTGVPWNGITAINETPSGAESNPVYADNMKYLDLTSAEEFGATVEALTYPEEFGQCDGSAMPATGVYVGQQTRKPFGLSYRTRIGNDTLGDDYGFKLHLVYGAKAAPSEKSRSTVNESPEAVPFSWELSTTAVPVPGLKPSATLTIDSTKVDATKLASFMDILYGTETEEARLPLPEEVIAHFGAITEPVAP